MGTLLRLFSGESISNSFRRLTELSKSFRNITLFQYDSMKFIKNFWRDGVNVHLAATASIEFINPSLTIEIDGAESPTAFIKTCLMSLLIYILVSKSVLI